jgi:K+ transporter
LIRVTARFGFMEALDIRRIVHGCSGLGLMLGGNDTTFYSADPEIVPASDGFWHAVRRSLFVFLRRNSRPVTASLGIPPDALAKLGMEVPM